jgi:hypothetical protein
MTKTTVTMNDVVGNLKRVIEGARARNVAVLFGPMAYSDGLYRGGLYKQPVAAEEWNKPDYV